MPISRRYSPEWAPGEKAIIGFDFSPIVPPGVGISAGSLALKTNTVPPADASADWTPGTVSWRDRTLYATLQGGVAGKDYLLVWTATDTDGNIWPRTAAMLCAPTS